MTVSFVGHAVSAYLRLGSVAKHGAIASNVFGITDVGHCGEAKAFSTNSDLEYMTEPYCGDCTV